MSDGVKSFIHSWFTHLLFDMTNYYEDGKWTGSHCQCGREFGRYVEPKRRATDYAEARRAGESAPK